MQLCWKLISDEEGATSIEYAVCMLFIIVACIGGVTLLGLKNGEVWGSNSSGILEYL